MKARRLIAAGAIGPVVSVHANFAISSLPGSGASHSFSFGV